MRTDIRTICSSSLLIKLEEKHNILVAILFIIYLLIATSIYNDYGLPWDELIQRNYGLVTFDYVVHGDDRLLTYRDRDYGPVFEVALVIIEKVGRYNDPLDIILMRHFCTFLLFYINSYFFYLLCKTHFNSWKIGLLGCLFLILSPRIFAHSFYNSKDLTFLSLFVISMYTMLILLKEYSVLKASLHALACAFLIDIRVLGIIVPFFTLFFIGIDLRQSRSIKEKNGIISCLISFSFLLMCFTILFWPTLWERPLGNFIQAFRNMARHRWQGQVLYLGEYIESTELPWHYIPVWMLITIPIYL